MNAKTLASLAIYVAELSLNRYSCNIRSLFSLVPPAGHLHYPSTGCVIWARHTGRKTSKRIKLQHFCIFEILHRAARKLSSDFIKLLPLSDCLSLILVIHSHGYLSLSMG